MNRDRNRERRIHSARHWRLHDRIRYAKKIEQTAVSPHKLAPICRKNSKASFHCEKFAIHEAKFRGWRMSALPPIADMDQHARDVRFVPKSGHSIAIRSTRCLTPAR